jgi:DNA invertase Pin-like site-specific DNA recombinase
MSVYGYIRTSTNEQAYLKRPEQRRRIAEWAKQSRLGRIDRVFEDLGVSGGTEFSKRQAAGELLGILKDGDVVIIASLDRVFRKASDAIETVMVLEDRGISLHVWDLQIDVCGNELFFNIMSAVKDWDETIPSEVQKSSKSQMREQGRYLGGRLKTGVKRVAKGGKVIANRSEVRAINAILDMQGHGQKVIQYEIFEKYGVRKSLSTISRIQNNPEGYQSSDVLTRGVRKGGNSKAVKAPRKRAQRLGLK